MPDYTGTLTNGEVVSVRSIDPIKTSMFVDFVKDYFNNPTKDDIGYREMTSEEIAAKGLEIAKTNALARTSFTRIQIRDAFRALDMEATLNTLLASDEDFKLYWNENTGPIDLTHSYAVAAMANFTAGQIAAIKLKIAGIEA